MNCKYIKYAVYASLILSVIWGILWNFNVIAHSTGINFNLANFIFAVLFLLSITVTPALSARTGKKGIISFILGYWSLLFFTYHIGDMFNIKWLEKTSEFIILPFYSIFPVVWNYTDGETATVISLLFAYYVIPFLMIIYLSVMILKRNRIK